MEPKFFLKSKTVWGALVMLIGLVVGFFELPVTEPETQKLASLVLELAGFAFTVYGRKNAKQPLTMKGGRKAAGIALLLITVPTVVLSTGCAGMRNVETGQPLTAVEKARLTTVEISKSYETLHREYLRLETTLPPDGIAYLQDEVAPVMDTTRQALIALDDIVITWSRTKEKPDDYEALRVVASRSLTEIAGLIADVATRYQNQEKSDEN